MILKCVKNFIKPLAISLAMVGLVSCSENQPDVSFSIKQLPQEKAAKNVLERTTGTPLTNMTFKWVDDKNNPYGDWYQVTAANGKLVITGTSANAMTYGGYSYLKSIGAMSVSWEGNRVELPNKFSDFNGSKIASPFNQRVYLNVCAFGYTTPWWDWQRWEQEIDWMALHGVNNPVAMEGQEYIWQKLWKEFAITDEELAEHFSGPAFTPWHRMGNIESHRGVLPQSWINKKHDLQVKILARMRSLDMKPVLPAFSGYVPKAFVAKYPDAKIYTMEPWSGFEQESYWLDPADKMFPIVAKRFIEIYNETYGAGEYYLSDSFNEMKPPVSEENRYEDLARYGQAIYQSIQQVVPEATWVMQGWMFGADKHFWDEQSVEAFLSLVPNDKAMVHDIGNDRYDVWKDAQAFHNKQWVFGYIHNYGGSNPVYADFDHYKNQVSDLLADETTGNLTGFGVFPEGLHNNSVAYDFMFDQAWQGNELSIAEWIKQYTKARYGKTTVELVEAWSLLKTSVFSTKYWDSRWWNSSAGAYLLFKRPQAKMTEFKQHPGNIDELEKAVKILLSSANTYQNSGLYLYDLVDFYRHYMTMRIDSMLQETIVLYQKKEIEKADQQFAKIKQLIEGVDLLLGLQQESLATWIKDARNYADENNLSQADYYERSAKAQITIWGGDHLKDYASKAWQGLYKNFYQPRWEMFITNLKASVIDNKPFDQALLNKQLVEWENNWVEEDKVYKVTKPEDPIALMNSLLDLMNKS